MYTLNDFEDKNLGWDNNRGRVVRRVARKYTKYLNVILSNSGLEFELEFELESDNYQICPSMVDGNLSMLSQELKDMGYEKAKRQAIVDSARMSSKVCVKIRPRLWHVLIVSVVDSMFKPRSHNDFPSIVSTVVMGEIAGNMNWHFFHKSPALLLVDRSALEKLVPTAYATLKGLRQKRKLSEREYLLYAKVVWRGFRSVVESLSLDPYIVEVR